MKVILASASPRRQELLKRLYSDFTVFPADIDETLPDDISAEFAPIYLAGEKAEAIRDQFPNDLVITADTVVVLDDEILGKPTDRNDAAVTLRKLSGKTHKVITGCCLSYKGKQSSFSSESLVTFYPLTEEDIKEYVASEEPMGKAGSYGIQGLGSLLVEKIDGDFYNIVGLPIAKLKREITELLK